MFLIPDVCRAQLIFLFIICSLSLQNYEKNLNCFIFFIFFLLFAFVFAVMLESYLVYYCHDDGNYQNADGEGPRIDVSASLEPQAKGGNKIANCDTSNDDERVSDDFFHEYNRN